MNPLRKIFERTIGRFLSRLRFPQLFVLTAVLFLVDLAIPDVIPFVDEILLALGSLILGSLKERVGRKEDGAGGNAASGEAGSGVEAGREGRDAARQGIEEKGSDEDLS